MNINERMAADRAQETADQANVIRYASFKLTVANSLFTTVASVWSDSTKRVVAREALRLADHVHDGDSEYLDALKTIVDQGGE